MAKITVRFDLDQRLAILVRCNVSSVRSVKASVSSRPTAGMPYSRRTRSGRPSASRRRRRSASTSRLSCGALADELIELDARRDVGFCEEVWGRRECWLLILGRYVAPGSFERGTSGPVMLSATIDLRQRRLSLVFTLLPGRPCGLAGKKRRCSFLGVERIKIWQG